MSHVQPGCEPLAQTDSRQFYPALRQGGEREDQDPPEGDDHAGRDLRWTIEWLTSTANKPKNRVSRGAS